MITYYLVMSDRRTQTKKEMMSYLIMRMRAMVLTTNWMILNVY